MNRYLHISIILVFVLASCSLKVLAANDIDSGKALPQHNTQAPEKGERSFQEWDRMLAKYDGVYDEDAIGYCKKMIALARENQHKTQLAYGYSRLGEVYSFLQKDSLAITAYNEAADLYSRQGYRDSLKNIYATLVTLHQSVNNIPEAIERQRSLLELTEFFGEQKASANAERELAMLLARQGSFKPAVNLLNTSANYYKQQQDTLNLIMNKQLLATLYQNNGNIAQALTEINTAIDILDNHKSEENALLHLQKSILLLELGEKERGVATLLKTLELARENNSPQLVAKAAEKLVEVYERQGNYQKALDYHKVFMRSREALLTRSGVEAISAIGNQMKMKSLSQEGNDSGKQVQDNNTYRPDVNRYVIFGGAILILFLAVFVVWLLSMNSKLKNNSGKSTAATIDPSKEKQAVVLPYNALQVYEKILSQLLTSLETKKNAYKTETNIKIPFADYTNLFEVIEIIRYLLQVKLGTLSIKNQNLELNTFLREQVAAFPNQTISYKIDDRLYKHYAADKRLISYCLKLLIKGTMIHNQNKDIILLIEPVGESLNHLNICACNKKNAAGYEKAKVSEKSQFTEIAPDDPEHEFNAAFLLTDRIATAIGGRFRVLKTLEDNYIFSLILPLQGNE